MRNHFLYEKWQQFREISLRKKLAIAGILAAGFLIIVPLLTYGYFARDIRDPERLMNRNNTGVVLLDRNGETIYSFGTVKSTDQLTLDQISDHVEEALISAEDKNFYEHNGFSVTGILGAVYANLISGDPTAYGGSTLTQQLAKNTLLTNDKNFLRKYQELSIAIAIERHYSKDEILAMYLNSVYFGEGSFGITAAAKTYFNKSAQDLTLSESAMLIGLLPAPSAYSPISGDPELSKQQQDSVLSRMQDNGEISEQEKTDALATKLTYAPAEEGQNAQAPHFAQMVLNELYERYGEEQVTRSGYEVKTTLDLKWQKQANEIVDNQMPTIMQGGGSNASLVAIDPNSGEVRALVGSADWDNEEFGKVNMAVTARQPGSSFKPLYYTEALQKGVITPATILKDEPTTFGANYQPENYDFRYRGDITARNALGQSLNIPAVKVMEQLGVSEAAAAAERMGISTLEDPEKYGLSLALGAAEAKLIEMTNVYAAFANEGTQFEPTTILSINNKFDRKIFTHRSRDKKVMGKEASFLISDMLSDDIARAPTFGGALNVSGRDVAVKTGTTDEARDAWTIGYTPQLAVGVWVGNNDNRVMTLGGSGMAGPIWLNALTGMLDGAPSEEFVQPAGVERVLVCRATGQRAYSEFEGTYSEYFMSGTLPQGTCEPPKEEEKPKKKKEDEEEPEEEAKPEEEPREEPIEEPTEPGPRTEEPVEGEQDKPTETTDPAPAGGRGAGGPPSTGDTSEDTTMSSGDTEQPE